jgi:hypothetical protein
MMSCVLETTRLQLRPCQIEDVQIVQVAMTELFETAIARVESSTYPVSRMR